MILGSAFLIILYLIFRYIIAWITYYNNLDPRLGESTWRFTYDYPVVGERDISDPVSYTHLTLPTTAYV